MKEEKKWLAAIKASLGVDLLKPKLRRKIAEEDLSPAARQVRGHCYLATEVGKDPTCIFNTQPR